MKMTMMHRSWIIIVTALTTTTIMMAIMIMTTTVNVIVIYDCDRCVRAKNKRQRLHRKTTTQSTSSTQKQNDGPISVSAGRRCAVRRRGSGDEGMNCAVEGVGYRERGKSTGMIQWISHGVETLCA